MTNQSGPSPYIPYYSMTREPFSNRVEDDLYYPEPLRKQRLEILLHLTQYSNELMLVIGPQGSGKTTLLQQYRQHALDSWSVGRIEGSVAPDDRQFLQQLYRQMGLEFRGATQSEMTERMEQHFLSLQRNGRQAVMLVDDADKLPVNTLKNILAMARLISPEGKPLVRVILFGTRDLVQDLQNSHLGHHAAIAKRSIELPPFNQEQTANYILHRLSAAQYSASTPFTDSTIAKIHKRANGWPGAINQLARECLLDSMPASPKAREPLLDDMPSTLRPKRILALLVTVAVIGALLLYQDEINKWFTPGPAPSSVPLALPEPSPSQTIPANEIGVVTSPVLTTPTENSDIAEQSQQTTASTHTIPESSTTEASSVAVDIPTTPTMEPVPEPHPEAVTSEPLAIPPLGETSPELNPPGGSVDSIRPNADLPSSTLPPITTAKDKASAPATPIAATPSVSPTTPNTPINTSPVPTGVGYEKLPSRQNSWVQSQDPRYFTLQLVAGNNLETLLRFMDDHNLTDNLAVYHSQRDGKPWHGLLYGVYSTKQAAIDARSQLPADLRAIQPWIRDLDGIQKSLHQAP